MIDLSDITGVILAGGRGSRMGGADKGLQNFNSVPLALHTQLRLSPQVGELLINANRNLAAYESFGVPVWPDAASLGDFAGPLAGFLTGLERAETAFVVTVPCDTPLFPLDLVARLVSALETEDAEIAMAAAREEDGHLRAQPVFCLMRSVMLESVVGKSTLGQPCTRPRWCPLIYRAMTPRHFSMPTRWSSCTSWKSAEDQAPTTQPNHENHCPDRRRTARLRPASPAG
jgi:molybdopterin-guanine dinucleotide biosynthesis protein A